MSTSKQLQGKVAVITGGTSGIGLATAALFKSQGAHVVVTGRNADGLAQAARTLGDDTLVLRADASSKEDTDALITAVKERWGRIDVLFANAGIARFAPIEAVDGAFVDELFNINFGGVYFTVQKALPLIPEGGSIIVNTSVTNQSGMPNTSVYAATKAALRSLVRTLAAELAPRKIRINAVSPGPIETPIYGKLGLPAEEVDDFASSIVSQVPAARFGQPAEIASAVLFLASSSSSYVIGSEIAVDGGFAQV